MKAELIFNKLMEYKNFHTKTELSNFMGISIQSLNGWIERNTLPLNKICTKFPEIDANWLLTGEGEMLKQTYHADHINGGNAQGDGAMNNSNDPETIQQFLNEIAAQRQLTEKAHELVAEAQRQNAVAQEQITKLISKLL